MSDYIAPFRLCGNIYFVGTEKASSHLIDTGDGLILIDTGYNTTAEVIVNSMKELGFDIKDVKIILHSHGHLDHTGGTPEILKLCSAKTYLGKEDLRYLKGSFEPDEYYEDGQVIELGTLGFAYSASTNLPKNPDGLFMQYISVETGTVIDPNDIESITIGNINVSIDQ